KRRSPLLQPIIEGETASFFKEIKVKTPAANPLLNPHQFPPPLPPVNGKRDSRSKTSPYIDQMAEALSCLQFLAYATVKEEEEGSEDDSNTKPDFMVTLKTDFSARCLLDQFEDDADGFISPMDDKIPSKCSQDTGLSNLHAASIPELLEHLQEMREEKKRIRKNLRDFEDNFFRQNG
ncbi:Protein fam13a, partial [Saguinus oedipus]